LEGCDICQDVRDNPPKQTKLEKLNLDQSVWKYDELISIVYKR
jgi:hypothetical protein